MQYRRAESLLEYRSKQLLRNLTKGEKKKYLANKEEHRKAVLSEILSDDSQMQRFAFTLETLWEKDGFPAYYVTPEILEILSTSKFDVAANEVRLLHRVVSICLPDTCKLPPFTFSLCSFDKDYSPTFESLANTLGVKVQIVNRDSAPDDRLVSVMMWSKCGKYSQLILPSNKCYRDTIDTWMETNLDLTGGNPDEQKQCILLGLKIAAYLQAFPNALIPGVPNSNQLQQKPTGSSFCVGIPEEHRNTPISHLRSGHFRCLRHERFKRDANGNMRIVWVSPSIIGDLSPYHVQPAS